MKIVALRQYAFTLIEVMVSFSLVSLLLVVGFGAYSQMSLLEREGTQLRHAALQQRLAQARLASLLLRIPTPEPFPGKPKPSNPKNPPELPSRLFYSSERFELGLFQSGSLVFTYDNQTDLIPEFCNNVITRLYVKEGSVAGPVKGPVTSMGALWLATWPRPDCSMNPEIARHEQLLEGVKSMHCRFYEPPQAIDTTSQSSTAPPPPPPAAQALQSLSLNPTPQADSWNETWSIAYAKLPTILHLHLEMEERNGAPVDPLDFYFPLLNTGRTPMIRD